MSERFNSAGDAQYAQYLREGTVRAKADSRPALPSIEARHRMDALKAQHRAQLEDALGRKKRGM